MTLSAVDAAREAPDRVALVLGGVPVTFAELAARVAPLSVASAGPPTPFVGRSDRATLERVYAHVTAAAPMLLLHPRLTESERRAVLAMLEPELAAWPATGAYAATSAHAATGAEAEPAHDAARCLAVLMTSGTTGRPKGVVLSRRAFLASARASEGNIGLRDGDRWLLGLPIAHVGGLSILTRSLIARTAVVVPQEVADGKRLDAHALVRTIEEDRVTLVSLVPTQLEWLLSGAVEWRPPAHLRAILLGGAAARPSLLERAAEHGLPVLTTYGLTEACSQVTTQRVGTVNRGELGSGPSIDGAEVRIRDGVIEVRGPMLFDGYLPAPGAPPFTPDGWFPTNDLGRLDDHGNLHVVGRRSELVITGGENVHPAEVEAVVDRCPGVAACCAFGVPDETWGELLAVAIVPAAGGAPDDASLAEFCRERLSSHRRPRLVVHVGELATNAAGKLDRAATRTRALPTLRRL
ncbi:MAG TPA: AMP-binding protein [Polyangiaceae bacterium]|nr:AMP-binding protein [Polyangiaceae bacterium]